MEIVRKKLDDLMPADYNPRKELQEADFEFQALKKSIQRFGLVIPIIENKTTGNMVGGHQRLNVLKNLGWTEVDVVVVEMSEGEEKALNLALNRIKGDWDKRSLTNVLQEIRDSGIKLNDIGFTKGEINQFFPPEMEVENLFGAELENPFSDYEDEKEEAIVTAMVGKYRIRIDRVKLEECIGDIRYRNGFVQEKVSKEIKLRLMYGKDWTEHVDE